MHSLSLTPPNVYKLYVIGMQEYSEVLNGFKQKWCVNGVIFMYYFFMDLITYVFFPLLLVIFLFYFFKNGDSKNEEIILLERQIPQLEEVLNNFSDFLALINEEKTTKEYREASVEFLIESDVDMAEPRARRTTGHGGVRVAKGAYIGGSSAKSFQELTLLETGKLILYVDELIFTSTL